MSRSEPNSMIVVLQLMLVECRKLVTTLSTRVFLIVVAGLGGVVGGFAGVLGQDTMVNGAAVVAVLGLLFTIAMPVVGVLIFTSDWQHREIASMFLAQPRRLRTFLAKVLATIVVAGLLLVGAAVCAFGISAALAVVLSRPLVWDGLGEAVPLLTSGSLVGVLAGAALGAALKNAAAAIAASFLQSLVLDPLFGFLPNGIGPFLKTSAITDFASGAGELIPFLTATLLWLVLPFGVGLFRHLRGEVA